MRPLECVIRRVTAADGEECDGEMPAGTPAVPLRTLDYFGYAHALQAFGVIFAVEDVPLFAALEDLALLGCDLGADFGVNLLFEFQDGR